jgi:C-lobe and N-lobe beta barrels of Tf-binding protein B
MKTKLMQLLLLTTIAPVLAACGSSSAIIGKAPFSDLYMANYAEEGETIGSVLSGPGKALESATVSTRIFFGDRDVVRQSPGKLIIERLGGAPGSSEPFYKVTYGDIEVIFTGKDIETDDDYSWLKKIGLSNEDEERTIAELYSLNGDNIFEQGDQIMIPVGYGLRVKRDGTLGTADRASGFVDGYSIIGLETNPNAMPKDRTATYEGGAEFKLRNQVETEGAGIDEIRFNGDSEMQANFTSGKVSGSVLITRSVIEDYDIDRVENDDLEDLNAQVALSGDIISNGFTLGLDTNAAADTLLADVGITDLTAEGAGRFYGTEAQAIGALISGESKNYLLNGVIWGNRDD